MTQTLDVGRRGSNFPQVALLRASASASSASTASDVRASYAAGSQEPLPSSSILVAPRSFLTGLDWSLPSLPNRKSQSDSWREVMARKKITPEERRRMERVKKIKEKAKNREIPIQKADDLCAICDEGGAVTYCDGGCQRCFHLKEPKCRLILGLDIEQAKIYDDKKRDFICKNCKYKEHQCFACGKLGSSDLSSGAKVFRCKHNDCVRFYHPKCVAKLLYPVSEAEASRFELQIAAGEEFNCPVHECNVCKGGEEKDDKNMQFAVCRRCPTAYHRKCLPSDILFEPKEGRNGHVQRAWEELVDSDGDVFRLDPIVIYCTKHEIVTELGTPKLNHIIFPKKIREPKVLVAPPNEEDIRADDELPIHPSSEPSQSPPPSSDQNKCSCSSPLDSFAPSSLFPHPHPGSGGWLDD
ncbi:hypothetical protein EJB05_02868, partial [Eragrostis curvula]